MANSSQSRQQFDLVVAGRGIVGSAFALAAAQLGLRTALVGRPINSSVAEWDDRVFAIAPRARAWLDTLKVGRQLDPTRLAPVRTMRIADGVRATARKLQLSSYGAAIAELATIIESRELHRILDLGLGLQPRVAVHDGEIEACAFSATHGAVTLKTPTAGHATFEAPLLIAADGPDSILRAAADIEGKKRDYGQRGLVARLRLAKPHHGAASQWFLGDSVLAMLPLPPEARDAGPSRHASLVWSVDDERAERLLGLDAIALAREIESACDESHGQVEVLSAAQGFPLRYFAADHLVSPRLALVGDAAHLMHPLAGQGLNTGLLDAAALVDTLAARESFRDIGDLRLLRRYERARAEPISRILLLTDGLQRLFRADNPLVGTVRMAGLGLIEGLPPVKRMLVHEAVG